MSDTRPPFQLSTPAWTRLVEAGRTLAEAADQHWDRERLESVIDAWFRSVEEVEKLIVEAMRT